MSGRRFAVSAGVTVPLLMAVLLLEGASTGRLAASRAVSNSPLATNPANVEQTPLVRSVPAGATPTITYVRPRSNIQAGAPFSYGFWSFAVPVPGVLSRSGQPLLPEFMWLKSRGWKSVVNLRVDGERGGEVGDDTRIPSFSTLGFSYLHVPIMEEDSPTNEQAEKFLRFVTDPANQPVHVHCRNGIGRTGTFVALYRYAVQGWPMEEAIRESRAFLGGVSPVQAAWLRQWASVHSLGSYATSAVSGTSAN